MENNNLSLLLFVWLFCALLSFGGVGINYVIMRKMARKPWKLQKNDDYKPKISIIVPTYNEGEVIRFKLKNLLKINYPRNLMQIVFVDSQSTDSTFEQILDFAKKNEQMNIKIIRENERRGKSFALNTALKSCIGDILIVSDADCFWPSHILYSTLSYFKNPSIGAISGPKKLLNPDDSWVTKNEDIYLKSMNLIKLGESKISSTIFFEGGFCAYRREILDSFDPYNTGSDDCGTVIDILSKGYRAIMISEAEFYTFFPKTLREKLEIKIRRSNQLLRLFEMYIILLFKGKIKIGRKIIIKNLILYAITPLIFCAFSTLTVLLILNCPYIAFLIFSLFIPRIRTYVVEVIMGYTVFLMAFLLTIFGRKRSIVWKPLRDKTLIKEDILLRKNLI